jgi:HAD superfamily hydrolase (TIGR01509 family)
VKKGIIFDLDGVLVNSMPTHIQAWKQAFAKIVRLDISERDIYLLEGMRGMELVIKIFEQKGFQDHSLAKAVQDEKSKIFKEIRSSEPFEGVEEMIDVIRCKKAVVSGSTRNDVETIIEEAFGKGKFDVIITADDIKKGKPDPSAFLEALRRMNVKPQDAVVVENAPLGAKAAKSAGIGCLVALNNTPLKPTDFDGIIAQDRIFAKTGSLKGTLEELCK